MSSDCGLHTERSSWKLEFFEVAALRRRRCIVVKKSCTFTAPARDGSSVRYDVRGLLLTVLVTATYLGGLLRKVD